MKKGKQSEGKNPEGRPPVVTPAVVQKLEEAYSWDATDEEACFHAGISERSLYYYQVDNPEFLQRKKALKNKPVLAIRQTVIAGIVGQPAKYNEKGKLLKAEVPPNPELGLKYLERKKKDEFSTRVEQTGKDGQPILEVNELSKTVSKMTPEERKKRIAELEKINGKNEDA